MPSQEKPLRRWHLVEAWMLKSLRAEFLGENTWNWVEASCVLKQAYIKIMGHLNHISNWGEKQEPGFVLLPS